MTLIWIAVAFSGAIFGFAAARAAKPTGKYARNMAWAFALLLGCFLVAPLIRLPLQHVLDSSSSWRLFEVYSYGSVFAIALFSSSLLYLSLIHISEPTRLLSISYAVFCLKK